MSVDWTDTDETIAADLRNLGVETDLSDADLASKARAAIGEIAHHTGLGVASVQRFDDGGRRFVALDPPAATLTTVTEDGTAVTVDGYRLRPRGVLLERLAGGSPTRWGRNVHVIYAPPASDERYDRVVTDLVKLALEYSGLDMRRDGDYSETSVGGTSGGQKSYQDQREEIIGELAGAWLR